MTASACQVEGWELWDGHLCFTATGECYERVRAPRPVVRAWRDVLSVAGLRCNPRLTVVESTGGRGGLYYGGMVIIGLADVADSVSDMSRYFRRLPPREAEFRERFDPMSVVTDADLYESAYISLLAHEVGHAIRDQWDLDSHGPHEEMAADNIAGQITAALGTDPNLDRVFFHAAGCASAPFCSHPSSEQRVAAYDQGRLRRRSA